MNLWREKSPESGFDPPTLGATVPRGLQACLAVVPYARNWHCAVTSLLHELPMLYPNADKWLEKRLQDVLDGRARGSLVVLDRRLLGVAIETPKLGRGWKLSTICVAPEYRNCGVGRALVEELSTRWIAERVAMNTVTVRKGRDAVLLRLLGPFGFVKIDEQVDRYGLGATEVVLQRRGSGGCHASC